jgi:copper homeostasis protein (lipoprotein)
MKSVPVLVFAVVAVALSAAAAPEPFRIEAPQSYSGTLPCADCEGIRVTLDLFPDGGFISRDEYLGKNRSGVDAGRWSSSDDGTLTLTGGTEPPTFYRPAASDVLKRLDREKNEIKSDLNYELKREPEFRLIQDPIRLGGLFSHVADAGRLTICLTAQNLPVASEGDNAALERAYAEKRSTPGAPLFVTFTGHFAERPRPDGKRKQLAIVVEKFDRAWPGEPCKPPLPGEVVPVAPTSPEGRTWKLVSLFGKRIDAPDNRRSAHLVFDAGRHRIFGSSGCNKLDGRYALDGDQVRFSYVATTRVGCPGGGDLERNFLSALGETTGFRISGNRLVLYEGKNAIAELREIDFD